MSIEVSRGEYSFDTDDAEPKESSIPPDSEEEGEDDEEDGSSVEEERDEDDAEDLYEEARDAGAESGPETEPPEYDHRESRGYLVRVIPYYSLILLELTRRIYPRRRLRKKLTLPMKVPMSPVVPASANKRKHQKDDPFTMKQLLQLL